MLHVWRKGEVCTRCWWGNQRERDHWGDPSEDGRIICKMDLQEVGCGGVDWIELAQDRDRWRTGTCECGNELWGSIKCLEFLD
jgi:hypothetical protein